MTDAEKFAKVFRAAAIAALPAYMQQLVGRQDMLGLVPVPPSVDADTLIARVLGAVASVFERIAAEEVLPQPERAVSKAE